MSHSLNSQTGSAKLNLLLLTLVTVGQHFHSLRAAAVGFERPPKRNQWHDEECRTASAAKNDAYKRTLQSATTRAIVADYRQKRREERRLIRCKKREQERREREEIEMYRSRNDAKKFLKTSSF